MILSFTRIYLYYTAADYGTNYVTHRIFSTNL